MAKYSIFNTKEDYEERYKEIETTAVSKSVSLDWKKIKRLPYDALIVFLEALKRKQ